MNLRTAAPDRNTVHSVPPMFVTDLDRQRRHAPHVAQPGNPDQTSMTPQHPEGMAARDDALNDRGEGNHRQQQG